MHISKQIVSVLPRCKNKGYFCLVVNQFGCQNVYGMYFSKQFAQTSYIILNTCFFCIEYCNNLEYLEV